MCPLHLKDMKQNHGENIRTKIGIHYKTNKLM